MGSAMQAHCSSAAAVCGTRVDAMLAIFNSSLAQALSARRTEAAQLCPGAPGHTFESYGQVGMRIPDFVIQSALTSVLLSQVVLPA